MEWLYSTGAEVGDLWICALKFACSTLLQDPVLSIQWRWKYLGSLGGFSLVLWLCRKWKKASIFLQSLHHHKKPALLSGRTAHHRSLPHHRTLFSIFVICASFWLIENVMGVLAQALEIILEVQRQRSNEKKIAIRKICNHKMRFFLFEPLLLSKLFTFSFLVQFKWFKVLQKCHLEFDKSSLNSNSNRAPYKEVFGCLKTDFVTIGGLFKNPLYFLNSNPFLTIFNASDASIGEGFKFCLDIRNNRALPLDPAWPERLSVGSMTVLP
jgi:hypothetical protein